MIGNLIIEGPRIKSVNSSPRDCRLLIYYVTATEFIEVKNRRQCDRNVALHNAKYSLRPYRPI
jgi:hypothetical protein